MFANAPTAVSQSPSKTFKTLLSAFVEKCVDGWSTCFNNSIKSSSLFLHCKAITPCPAQGITSDVEKIWDIFWFKPKELIPA